MFNQFQCQIAIGSFRRRIVFDILNSCYTVICSKALVTFGHPFKNRRPYSARIQFFLTMFSNWRKHFTYWRDYAIVVTESDSQ